MLNNSNDGNPIDVDIEPTSTKTSKNVEPTVEPSEKVYYIIDNIINPL